MIHGQCDLLIPTGSEICPDTQQMEFHINSAIRKQCDFDETLFSSSGNVIFANITAVQRFVQKYNKTVHGANHPEQYLKAGQLNAMGLIDEIFHYVCRQYRLKANASFFSGAADAVEKAIGADGLENLLETFTKEFPPMAVYQNKLTPREWLSGTDSKGIPNKALALEELMLLKLANENPAFEPFFRIFSDKPLSATTAYAKAWEAIRSWSVINPPFGPEGLDLISMLKAPVEYSPYDLKGQLDYIRTRWLSILGEWLSRLLSGLDLIAEDEKAGWSGGIGSGTPDMQAYEFGDISKEYERFSPDKDWMPNVILIAKSALVWLSQLTAKYGRPITRLDQIPDDELDALAGAGFTGLWLIGLWERSPASARIKQICGNPEAAASAYSLDDYDIAGELGGWDALNQLRTRAWKRGIRMASDMVPNHTGMDAKWVVEKPDLFVQTRECPFPGYDFNGENLSHDGRVGIYLENHYYSKSDCAVVFKRVDNATGDTRYIYHGNDGTGMPWNDTAQIDFLKPEAREEVIQKILHVARNFPIIRFDAAMVLAKKHIQRLWYPEPGKGGDIASRSRFAISRDEFERRIPEEFWREVVDRCAKEIPDTLLLAEAFWMMEGFFVRTLGMHRVYNSAFMNMLNREDNEKYRTTIKNTIEFDPEILKRYVNFMNNPDEETAAVQFGRGDKYFGVCTMMVAMPGLPMFGHGQVEGFEEKYGMEYRKAYKNEQADENLVNRHRREIFPLMKKRWLFAGVENFRLYDFWENGCVNENVFAWSNRAGTERAVIFYNNVYQQATGWINASAASIEKHPDGSKSLVQKSISESIGLTVRPNRFCVMQEQRSGLWYIRTTEEIAAKGLFASLNGFQTQVFVNIYEIDDNADGHYRILYDTLKGSGISNIHMGIQNIVLKDLYKALTDLATPEYFERIKKIFEQEIDKDTIKERTLQIRKFLEDTQKSARLFFKACVVFFDGSSGVNALPGMQERKKAADSDIAWARFSQRIERLLTLPAIEKLIPVDLVPESLRLTNFLTQKVLERDAKPEIMGAAIALYSIRDLAGDKVTGSTLRQLVESWSLDLKMAEIFACYGYNEEVVLPEFQSLKELLVLVDTEVSRIVPILFSNQRLNGALGIHVWDHISWFNKESSEEILSLSLVAKTILNVPGIEAANKFSFKDWNTQLVELSKEKKKALSEFEESGYQTEKLLALYAPPVKIAEKKIKSETEKAPRKGILPIKKTPKKK